MPKWMAWTDDPVARKTGISFDRTPAGAIVAPAGRFRVCAYHIDFDERPTCYVDVDTLEEAMALCADVGESQTGFNVDFAIAYDDTGTQHGKAPWDRT